DATAVVVLARGKDASVAGGGVRINQTAPTHTTTVATDAANSRPIPNHSTHARARSAGERGTTGLDNGSTIDLLDPHAHDGRTTRAHHGRTTEAHDAGTRRRHTMRHITRRESVASTLPRAAVHPGER
ncbi:MAG TPA: hypothetical protein VLN74_03475, partial [Ilumatobacteraceae bacterium]|nr:hypothetical protein [Ilumatobacteraceae bacterium]